MFFVSLSIAFASLVNLGLLGSDFVVSAGIIIFVIFLYHYDDMSPVPLGILSGIMVFVMRVVVHELTYGDAFNSAVTYIIEFIFYIIYSLFFRLFIKKEIKNNLGVLFVALIICDFGANFVEGLIRYYILTKPSLVEVIPSLLVVSVVRSVTILIVLNALNYYGMLLTKREHEERYKKLLYLTSKLKSELFWIEKNMENIEKVMTQSYELFEQIRSNEEKESWANKALTIAKDVHEIKKENGLVVRGIKDITQNELKDSGMEYKDINNILLETMKRESKINNKNIDFQFDLGENFYTSKHYYLMSVLRNLIMNSMDAIEESQNNAKISVIHKIHDQEHVFKVSDNGEGIEEDDLKQIFSPGFSTKINYDTGEINRGLGLSIVQYIVEEQLNGKVDVKSKIGFGTDFIIRIPKIFLEEVTDENIHS
jgi:two-component system sensor histidine kinase YcbA